MGKTQREKKKEFFISQTQTKINCALNRTDTLHCPIWEDFYYILCMQRVCFSTFFVAGNNSKSNCEAPSVYYSWFQSKTSARNLNCQHFYQLVHTLKTISGTVNHSESTYSLSHHLSTAHTQHINVLVIKKLCQHGEFYDFSVMRDEVFNKYNADGTC